MNVPEGFRTYSCAGYYASEWAERGLWDESAQLMFVLPASQVQEKPELSFLVVARPGVDGIEFGYRTQQVGLWAFHPVSSEFIFLASSLEDLVKGWYAGDIRV